jgi:site-specific recombinase XerD
MSHPCGPGCPGEASWLHPFYEAYRDSLLARRDLSPRTHRNYLNDLSPFWAFLHREGVRGWEGVHTPLLRRYLLWLMTEAKVVRRKGRLLRDAYAPRSIARQVSALRSLFRFLYRNGHIPRDPTALLSLPKGGRTLPQVLDTVEAQVLVETPHPTTPQALRDRAILELLYGAGLRLGEVVALRVDDLDLVHRQVRVRGKGDKERIAFFGVPAREALARYLEEGRPALLGARTTDALFLNRWGSPLSPRWVQALVKKWAVRAGLDASVHPHTLRHSFATHLLQGGADLRVVQELLGHASPTTTQVYTQLTHPEVRRVYLAAHPRARRGDQDPGLQGEGRGL